MKKVLIMVMALFVLMPITNAFAYTGGLLDGKALNIGGNHSTSSSTSLNFTDNDIATNVTMSGNGGSSDTVWYSFSSDVDLTDYQASANGPLSLKFYDISGIVLGTIDAIDGSNVKKPINVLGVRKVALNTTTGASVTVGEFDVFSGGVPLEEISYDDVTALFETHTYGSANLSWTNPTGAEFTGTIIKQNGIEVAQLANTTSSYSITGLDADTLYSFEVIAKYSDGINSSGQTVVLTTDAAPVDSTAPMNISNVQVVKSDELASFMYTLPVDTDFSHLKIYRDGVLLENNFTGTSFDDFALVQNTTYVYKFISVDLSGNESNGFVQSVTTDVTVDGLAPTAPNDVVVTDGNSSGAVSWSASAESDVSGYNVFVDGVKHNTSLVLATNYMIPNLTNGQNYSITVTAVDTSDNESVPSVAQMLIPTSQAMPFFEAKYDLKDVADGTSQWFGSLWLILAFSVGIPLAFMVARKVKGLLLG